MCGIIYAKSKKDLSVTDIVWRAYMEQKHRGEQGFGFLYITNKKVRLYRSQYDTDIKKHLKSLKNASEILFHHRYPTSTPNLTEASHPIKISNKQLQFNYYVVHNGVITNDDELYAKHNKLGFKYSTKILTRQITVNKVYETYCYNDSETLAIELALFLEGKKASIDCEGSIAFMLVQTDKNDKPLNMFYGRNYGSPLVLCDKKNLTVISSESSDITLDDIKENVIYKKDYTTGKITESFTKIGKSQKPVIKDYTYKGDGMGFAGYDDEFYNDSMQEEIDEYYELLEEEVTLKKDLKIAITNKDFETQADINAELFYVQEAIKDYERRYSVFLRVNYTTFINTFLIIRTNKNKKISRL